jgi:putative transposase
VQLVERRRIDRHDPRWAAIDAAAFSSKNLYNAALYLTRQTYIKDHTVLVYGELDRLLQSTEEYRALPAKVAQWVLKQVCFAWTSSFAACREWAVNPDKFQGHPTLPKYREKQGRNLLTYTTRAISQHPKNVGWIVPSGLAIRVATKQSFDDIAQVRIAPHATHYIVEVIYEQGIIRADVDPQWVAGIDLGVNNLATLTANQPGFIPCLVNGRPLKAVNQFYNKRRAHYQALLPDSQHTSHRIDILTDRRDRQIDRYLHVASRRIIDRLVQRRIGMLIIGKNDGWKQDVNLGKRTNQTFAYLPHARFIEMLHYKARLVGIQVMVAEESDTSKCSFLDGEPLAHQERYAGRRVKRGLFLTATGKRLNADVNGAYNILVKVVPNAFSNGRAGAVVRPVRLHLANRRLAS